MAKDFFDGLGGTLSKRAQSLTEKVGSVYESQKLKARIAGEERMAEKLMTEVGRIIYARFADGAEIDEDLLELCEEIKGHEDVVSELKASAANKKGHKICPACKKEVDQAVSFCPYCGAQVPDPEPEAAEEEPEFEEIPSEEDFCEVTEEASEAEEACCETAEGCCEAAEDAAEAVGEAAEDAVCEAACETAEDAVCEAAEEVTEE